MTEIHSNGPGKASRIMGHEVDKNSASALNYGLGKGVSEESSARAHGSKQRAKPGPLTGHPGLIPRCAVKRARWHVSKQACDSHANEQQSDKVVSKAGERCRDVGQGPARVFKRVKRVNRSSTIDLQNAVDYWSAKE